MFYTVVSEAAFSFLRIWVHCIIFPQQKDTDLHKKYFLLLILCHCVAAIEPFRQ